jgi:hypothetical protein
MHFETEQERRAWEAHRYNTGSSTSNRSAAPRGGKVGKTSTITQARGGEVGKTSWLIPGFLHRGALLYLAAEAGSGKSTFLYRCAEAITTGGLFLDQIRAVQGRVLVLQGDEPVADAEAKFRLMGLEAAFDIAYVEPPLDMAWAEQLISSHAYDAIVLDSATTLLATDEREVTDQSFARRLYHLGRTFSQHQVSGLIAAHLNKPVDGQIRKTITRHDIAGVAAIGAAVTDIWGLWRDPKPHWPDHYSLLCLGKRYCKNGTLWQLEGSQEDYSWLLREVVDGLLPQERLSVQERILDHLRAASSPQDCDAIAIAVGTVYEVARRCCIDLFAEGVLSRHKSATGKQGRPTYLYSVEVQP